MHILHDLLLHVVRKQARRLECVPCPQRGQAILGRCSCAILGRSPPCPQSGPLANLSDTQLDFYACLNELDAAVGRVLDLLDDLGYSKYRKCRKCVR